MVEWYDFTLYLYLTPAISRVFFGGARDSVIATLGVFAVSYVMRPVGAAVFGHFGDRIGRRNVQLISMSIMTAAMALTALLPGRATAGLLAPVLLFTLRCAMSSAGSAGRCWPRSRSPRSARSRTTWASPTCPPT
jgi:MHS family proline/betaine transporter-like MFS transporter